MKKCKCGTSIKRPYAKICIHCQQQLRRHKKDMRKLKSQLRLILRDRHKNPVISMMEDTLR